MDECKDCICLICRYKPCEDCFKCDLDGCYPHEECEEFEKE